MIGEPALFTEDAHGRYRMSDPETSKGAAIIAIGNAANNRMLALRLLAEAGDGGLSDFELSDRSGVAQTSIGVRRGELRDAGLVCRLSDGEGRRVSRPAPSGAPAGVWVITVDGRNYLEQHT